MTNARPWALDEMYRIGRTWTWLGIQWKTGPLARKARPEQKVGPSQSTCVFLRDNVRLPLTMITIIHSYGVYGMIVSWLSLELKPATELNIRGMSYPTWQRHRSGCCLLPVLTLLVPVPLVVFVASVVPLWCANDSDLGCCSLKIAELNLWWTSALSRLN